MATIVEALTQALQHHQAGNLAQAEQIYRQVLQADPNNADALHLLGLLAHQHGQQQTALGYLRQAVALNPLDAGFQNNLGLVYQALGDLPAAEKCWREAIRQLVAYGLSQIRSVNHIRWRNGNLRVFICR